MRSSVTVTVPVPITTSDSSNLCEYTRHNSSKKNVMLLLETMISVTFVAFLIFVCVPSFVTAVPTVFDNFNAEIEDRILKGNQLIDNSKSLQPIQQPLTPPGLIASVSAIQRDDVGPTSFIDGGLITRKYQPETGEFSDSYPLDESEVFSDSYPLDESGEYATGEYYTGEHITGEFSDSYPSDELQSSDILSRTFQGGEFVGNMINPLTNNLLASQDIPMTQT